MNTSTNDAPMTRTGIRLLDIAALVVGYSLAALALRAYWPPGTMPTPYQLVAAIVTYAWLGLALSGPFILLLNRNRRPGRLGQSRYTGAETAWLMIGGYWITFIIMVVPVSLFSPNFGLLPIFAAGLAWLFAPKRAANPVLWTHRAAVILLTSWPFAWGAMILLSKGLY